MNENSYSGIDRCFFLGNIYAK